ncbi:MAG: HAMP domain-containing sensor histidine kinase [Thermomicrobiales bacterium]
MIVHEPLDQVPDGEDDRPAPQGRMRRWLHAIWYGMGTPVRLFRQRTAIQLVVSYVAAVMIAIVLLQATIIAALFWQPVAELFDYDQVLLNPFLREESRSYAMWVGQERLVLAIDGERDATSEVDAALAQIVGGHVVGFETSGSRFPGEAEISHAVVVDTRGSVVASSNPDYAQVGESAEGIGDGEFSRVIRRLLALNGAVDPDSLSLSVSMAIDGRSVAAYPILAEDGTLHGAFLLEGPTLPALLGPMRTEIIRDYALDNAKQFWLFSIPALLVAIPFGVWRARSISKRLDRLASAADALAEGKLDTRVVVRRRDEIGRLGERFNEMGERIASTDRSRRAFISNVSHDLRTPVSIMQGTAERMVEARDHGQPVDVASIDVIQHETRMLAHLIDDLFTLAKLEEHSLRLDRVAMSVPDVVGEAVMGMRELAWSQQKVTVESLVNPDIPAVHADPTRVRQVINNLLYNALRHTPEGGLIVVQAVQRGSTVEIAISDTGRGIPPETLPNVFTRYYQAERSKRKAGGSGLGLSIVKQIVEEHGGTIVVESQLGQGTTFRFSLPVA